MLDNKAENLAKEQPSVMKRVLEAEVQGMEVAAAKKYLGLDGQVTNHPKEDEKIQGNVVSAVLGAMTGMNASLKNSVEVKEKEITAARANEDTVKQQFFQLQADALNVTRAELTGLMREIQAKNTPQAAIEGFKAFKSFFDEVAPKQTAPADGGERATRTVDNQTALKLEEMHQNHELAMKKIDLEIAQQTSAFNLQLMTFKEDSERHWAEYKDNKSLRGDALGGFQDLAAAIAAGIDKDRTGASQTEHATAQEGAAHTGRIEAIVKQFECEFCHQPVTVEDENATEVPCPTPGCNTVFHLRGKG